MQAELLVEHPRQDALEILAGRGLQHPNPALEVGRQVSADMHLALSAQRHHGRFLVNAGGAISAPVSGAGARAVVVCSRARWMSLIFDM